jgi:hypothetical protein
MMIPEFGINDQPTIEADQRECGPPICRVKISLRADIFACDQGATLLAEQRVERRLAAILAADVAGYSRLIGATRKGPWRG